MASNVTLRGRIGMKNLVYAILNESTDISGGTPVWGTPKTLALGAEMTFDPAASITPYFADDALSAAGETTGAKKISMKFLDLDPQAYADILGHTYANGELVLNDSDSSAYIAMGGKVLMNGKNSGAAVYEYVWFHKVLLQKNKRDMKTKADKIVFQEVMLDGLVVSLQSVQGLYAILARSDDASVAAATISGWFTAPQLPNPDLTALSVVAAKAVGNITFTFTKASGLPLLINPATNVAGYLPAFLAGVLSAGTYVWPSVAATTQVVTFTPTVAYTGGQVVTALAYPAGSGVRDTHGIGLAALYSIALTF